MQRQKIKSSTFLSVGYEKKNKIFEAEFTSNEVYQYLNVSQKIYNNFMSSNSKGRYFNKYIKDVFTCNKVEYL
jgi:hypothetical protein